MNIILDSNRPKRTIKSFASRVRLTPKQKLALAAHRSQFVVNNQGDGVKFIDIFERPAPTIIEIGFGMGNCLIELAQNYPDINFVGIEVYLAGLGATLATINELGLKNIKLYQGDAVEILKHQIPPESLAAVLLFFPDPWPKRRHHKRRIVQPDFVDIVDRCLLPGGYFHLATDVADYANHMAQVVNSHVRFHTYQTDVHDLVFLGRPKSKFELRAKRKDCVITDLVFVKQ